jgi:outer membrane protein assembly factor BamB
MKKYLLTSLVLASAIPLTMGGTIIQPETWPQWRGPTRDGVFQGPEWPASLGEKRLKQTWRKELSPGYSSPIVAEDRVFTVETKDQKHEIVRAFDQATGEQIWEAQWEGAMSVPFFAKANGSWARCTPAYSDGKLYVGGMRDVLVCLDAATGRRLWLVDFAERNKTPVPSFGFVSSPLVHGDSVYVQAGAAFVRLDKATGKTIWRSLSDGGGMNGSAFSSPVFAEIGGMPQLIVQTRLELTGVAPATGKQLWRQPVKAFRGMNILTPVVHEDGFFTSTYGGRTSLFKANTGGEGGDLTLAWDNKLQGYMSTPVVIDGHAYLHLRNTRFACVDLASGEVTWTTTDRFGKYMSMVVQGDKILALDQKGELFLFRANPAKFEKLDERKLTDNETWAHLAVVGHELFVRELNAIAAYEWR